MPVKLLQSGLKKVAKPAIKKETNKESDVSVAKSTIYAFFKV